MVIDGPAINVGQWTHLALAYDDSQVENPTEQAVLYVDAAKFHGDAIGHYGPAHNPPWEPYTTDADGNPTEMVWSNRLEVGNTPAATCTIGCHGSGRSFFDGLIDEVRVYKGALGPHAVRQDYQHSWCTTDYASADYEMGGLLGFWDFNEGEGNIASDSVWRGS